MSYRTGEFHCRKCGPLGSTSPGDAEAHELVMHSGRPTTYQTDPPTKAEAPVHPLQFKATSVKSTYLGNMDAKTSREIAAQTRAERNQEDRDDHW